MGRRAWRLTSTCTFVGRGPLHNPVPYSRRQATASVSLRVFVLHSHLAHVHYGMSTAPIIIGLSWYRSGDIRITRLNKYQSTEGQIDAFCTPVKTGPHLGLQTPYCRRLRLYTKQHAAGLLIVLVIILHMIPSYLNSTTP